MKEVLKQVTCIIHMFQVNFMLMGILIFLKNMEELHEFEYDLENGNLNEVEHVLKTGK